MSIYLISEILYYIDKYLQLPVSDDQLLSSTYSNVVVMSNNPIEPKLLFRIYYK